MYRKKSTLAKEYDICIRTVSYRIQFIKQHLDRYPKHSIIYVGKDLRIRDDAFRDVMLNYDAIMCGTADAFKSNERHIEDFTDDNDRQKIC